jgi:hypothetical protein
MQIPGYVLQPCDEAHSSQQPPEQQQKRTHSRTPLYFLCLPIYNNQQIESKLFL